MLEFNKQWEDSPWHEENTLSHWYVDFLEDYQLGKLEAKVQNDEVVCILDKLGLRTANPPATVPQANFYPCLIAWFDSDKGKE